MENIGSQIDKEYEIKRELDKVEFDARGARLERGITATASALFLALAA